MSPAGRRSERPLGRLAALPPAVGWLGLAAAVLGLCWWLVGDPPPTPPRSPLGWAPTGTAAMVRIDVPRLLAAELWSALVVADGNDGVRRIERLCGYNPLAEIDEAVLLTLADAHGELDRMAWVARGHLNRDRLSSCMREVMGADGGELVPTDIAGVPAVRSGGGSSYAAFVGGDAIVGGGETSVRAIVAAATLGAPSLEKRSADTDAVARAGAPTGDELTEMWGMLSADADVAAIAALPSRWQQALAGLAGRIDPGLAVLGRLQAVGVTLRLDDPLRADLLIALPSRDDARALQAALESAFGRMRRDAIIALSPFGPLLRSLRPRRLPMGGAIAPGRDGPGDRAGDRPDTGRYVAVEASATVPAVMAMIRAATQALSDDGPGAAADLAVPPPGDAPRAPPPLDLDEVIRAPSSASRGDAPGP